MRTSDKGNLGRLLIIDDEADFVAALADILEEFGYCVDSATSARQALALIEQHCYDVAVVDFRMPELNGIELHERLRAVQGDLATILLTAYADRPTHQAALDAGFWHVLEKPLDIPQVARMLEGLTQRPLLLIVDDEPDFCHSLSQVLHQHKIRAAYCQSVQAGKELLRTRRFDLVLLDVKFPNESPVELVRYIRQQDQPARILMMSGQSPADITDLTGIQRLGVGRVHQKPLDIDRLIQEVSKLNERSKCEFGGENGLN